MLIRVAKNMDLRISLPFLSYEISVADLVDHSNVDQRLKRLSTIKSDLQDSILAIKELEKEGLKKKREVDNLRAVVQKLTKDKTTTESLLRLPEENFARVLSRATATGRVRGLIDGVLIGLATGIVSSLIVWYFTKP
jgi:hypothetical protein